MKQKACTSNKAIDFLQQKSCGEYSFDASCTTDKNNKYYIFIAIIIFIHLILVLDFTIFDMVKWNVRLYRAHENPGDLKIVIKIERQMLVQIITGV